MKTVTNQKLPATAMETGVIYARGKDEAATATQISVCKMFAKSRSIHIVEVYTDIAKSGRNTDRPGFQEMMSAAESGIFKNIIVVISIFIRYLIIVKIDIILWGYLLLID